MVMYVRYKDDLRHVLKIAVASAFLQLIKYVKSDSPRVWQYNATYDNFCKVVDLVPQDILIENDTHD